MNLLEIIGSLVLVVSIFGAILWSLGVLTIDFTFEIKRDE